MVDDLSQCALVQWPVRMRIVISAKRAPRRVVHGIYMVHAPDTIER